VNCQNEIDLVRHHPAGFTDRFLVGRSSTLTWMRQRGLRLLGEFPTQQRARQRIDAWLEPQPLQFKAAINKTSSNMISVDPYNRTFPKYPKLIEDKGWIRSNTKLLTNCGMK
jgi:hypothetical protein